MRMEHFLTIREDVRNNRHRLFHRILYLFIGVVVDTFEHIRAKGSLPAALLGLWLAFATLVLGPATVMAETASWGGVKTRYLDPVKVPAAPMATHEAARPSTDVLRHFNMARVNPEFIQLTNALSTNPDAIDLQDVSVHYIGPEQAGGPAVMTSAIDGRKLYLVVDHDGTVSAKAFVIRDSDPRGCRGSGPNVEVYSVSSAGVTSSTISPAGFGNFLNRSRLAQPAGLSPFWRCVLRELAWGCSIDFLRCWPYLWLGWAPFGACLGWGCLYGVYAAMAHC